MPYFLGNRIANASITRLKEAHHKFYPRDEAVHRPSDLALRAPSRQDRQPFLGFFRFYCGCGKETKLVARRVMPPRSRVRTTASYKSRKFCLLLAQLA